MTKQDLMIILIVIAIALGAWLFITYTPANDGTASAIITLDGKKIKTVDLNKNQTFTISGPKGDCEIEVKDGKIRMLSSDCPDQTCVKTGLINKAGQSIVCIPNRIVIKIINKADNQPDTIAY